MKRLIILTALSALTALVVIFSMYLSGVSRGKHEAQRRVDQQVQTCLAESRERCRRSPEDCYKDELNLGLECAPAYAEGPEYKFYAGWPNVFITGGGDSLNHRSSIVWRYLFIDFGLFALISYIGWSGILHLKKKVPPSPNKPPAGSVPEIKT